MNNLLHSTKAFLLITSFCLILPQSLSAKTLFEAYYKILSNGVHVGYIIQRFRYEKANKRFESVSLIRTNKFAGNAFESLKSYSNDRYEPISYEYRYKEGKKIKLIDAVFNNDIMNAVVTKGTKKNNIQKKLKKGTFLSGFLGYLMLSNGLSINKKFNYNAIAEEDAQVIRGSAHILNKEKYKGIPVFRIRNSFKGTQFDSLVDNRSQVLHTLSKRQKLTTQITGSALEATQGQNLSTKSIQTLFGNIPSGTVNSYYKSLQKKSFAKSEKLPR